MSVTATRDHHQTALAITGAAASALLIAAPTNGGALRIRSVTLDTADGVFQCRLTIGDGGTVIWQGTVAISGNQHLHDPGLAIRVTNASAVWVVIDAAAGVSQGRLVVAYEEG